MLSGMIISATLFMVAMNIPAISTTDISFPNGSAACPGESIIYTQKVSVLRTGVALLDTVIKTLPLDGGEIVSGTVRSFRVPVEKGTIFDTDGMLNIPRHVEPGEYRYLRLARMENSFGTANQSEIIFEVLDCE